MEKNRINRFVQRYNLAGLIESVKWDVTDETLETSFISDDKSVLGKVSTTDFNFKNGSYGVYDTTKLTKMLSVLSNDVDVDTVDIDGKTVSLNISDKGTTATYMLADLTVIPAVPDLKQLPDFDVDISIDSTFITKFNKAKSALSPSPKLKSKISEASQRGRRKKIGASKGTKVRRGATGVQKTKGGEYVKYEKGSKAAGSFRAAFKKGCAAGAASFTWDGRKYSCKKK